MFVYFAQCVDEILNYAGAKHRSGDLFNNKSFLSIAGKWVKSGVKGIDNIYTQHKPALQETLDALKIAKLKPTSYPFLDAHTVQNKNQKYKLIYLFIIGGVTYEEYDIVEKFNREMNGIRVVLGGSSIHNSKR